MASTTISRNRSMRRDMTLAVATMIGVTVGAFVVGTGDAKADCTTYCNDTGASYSCSTIC